MKTARRMCTGQACIELAVLAMLARRADNAQELPRTKPFRPSKERQLEEEYGAPTAWAKTKTTRERRNDRVLRWCGLASTSLWTASSCLVPCLDVRA